MSPGGHERILLIKLLDQHLELGEMPKKKKKKEKKREPRTSRVVLWKENIVRKEEKEANWRG